MWCSSRRPPLGVCLSLLAVSRQFSPRSSMPRLAVSFSLSSFSLLPLHPLTMRREESTWSTWSAVSNRTPRAGEPGRFVHAVRVRHPVATTGRPSVADPCASSRPVLQLATFG